MNDRWATHAGASDHGSPATTNQAEITLDTDVKGREDAFNPAELVLAEVAACMLTGTKRAIPMLKFEGRSRRPDYTVKQSMCPALAARRTAACSAEPDCAESRLEPHDEDGHVRLADHLLGDAAEKTSWRKL